VPIRDLDRRDLPALAEINRANTPAVGDVTLSELEALFAQRSLGLGVEIDARLAGFCLLLSPRADYASPNYRWFDARYESFAYLDRVAFAPAHQGQGHGTALYREVDARVSGVAWFLLEVNLEPPNPGSLRFHARQGFTEVGRQLANGKLVSLLAKRL
jgi:predicted GNAT superfamily acetyltransferase